MAILIYTYSNPYKIHKEQYWALIKNAFHLCVSQTLVNGLCDQYKEFYKGKLTTITRFINRLYEDWESDTTGISQRAAIDNIIEYIDFNDVLGDDIKETDIKTSLRRNRSYVLESIRLMFELGMKPENIRTDVLTYEQKCIVAIYRELVKSQNLLFTLKVNFTKQDIDKAIDETIQDALRSSDNDIYEINN